MPIKVVIDDNEEYPVYSLSRKLKDGYLFAEIPQELLEEYEKVEEEWETVQRKLYEVHHRAMTNGQIYREEE